VTDRGTHARKIGGRSPLRFADWQELLALLIHFNVTVDAVPSTKIPNCRYVVESYAMYARYGKQRAGIAGGKRWLLSDASLRFQLIQTSAVHWLISRAHGPKRRAG